jgi:predicted dehydrogenase
MASPPDRLRWGVLGGANIALKAVIPAIRASSNGALTAIASRDPASAARLARELGGVTAHAGYAALIADPAVQAVYIPLPNHLHAEWAVAAARAGKHVLCEKPLAPDLAQARAMAEAARAAGVLLMGAAMYRFQERTRQIKARVDAGAIGELRLVRAAFCFRHANPADHRLRPEFGGGALLDVGFYGVDVACLMFDAAPESVYAQASYAGSGVDVTTVGLLRFSGGRLATVEASFGTALQQTYSLLGSDGAIDLPQDAFVPWGEAASYTLRGPGDAVGAVEHAPNRNQYQLMVEHFAEAACGTVAPAYTVAEGLRTMGALDALARSARSGRPESP